MCTVSFPNYGTFEKNCSIFLKKNRQNVKYSVERFCVITESAYFVADCNCRMDANGIIKTEFKQNQKC